jgi:hypothetical protein
MANQERAISRPDVEVEFEELSAAFRQGKISRREFVQRSAAFGLSAVLMNKIGSGSQGDPNHVVEAGQGGTRLSDWWSP